MFLVQFECYGVVGFKVMKLSVIVFKIRMRRARESNNVK